MVTDIFCSPVCPDLVKFCRLIFKVFGILNYWLFGVIQDSVATFPIVIIFGKFPLPLNGQKWKTI